MRKTFIAMWAILALCFAMPGAARADDEEIVIITGDIMGVVTINYFSGVVVTWDQGSGHMEYTEGTTKHLEVEPAGEATWGISYGVGGIFCNGEFFRIPGVKILPAALDELSAGAAE